MLNIEPEVMYGAGSGSGWGRFVWVLISDPDPS